MSEHIETRKKVQGIASISTFKDLIEQTILSDSEKQILVLHYLENKDFRFIADMLGYSESTIKRKHKKALTKISKILL